MWHDILDRNNFIKSLYTNVPALIDVRIIAVKIEDEGQRISLEFIMPKFADTPPEKWLNLEYNSVYIKLDFFDIDELVMKATRDKLRGNIAIEKTKEDKLKITVIGNANIQLIAHYGMFQSISGYVEGLDSCN